MRKDQRGFTIVELIIAVAILAIVTLAVGGFMVVGSRSYTSANTDIMLQQDAQLALNQISDVIIDTTDSISYSVGDSSGLQTVLKDSEYGGEATDKCLTVVNRKEPDSNNDNPSYWFYWSKEKETIYFNEVPVDSTMSEEEIKNGFADAEIAKAVLAEHVTDLQIDVSQFEENRVVMISMTFENGGRQYSTSNNVTVRNRIALNAIDVAPMKIADEFLITNLSPVTLEPGDDYTFEAHVDTSSDDRELQCELSGNADSDTRITGVTTADGGKTVRIAVHVGIKEMGPNFLLKVSRAHEQYEGQNKRVSVSAQIKVKRVNAVNITGPASAKQGATVSLTGSASGPQLGYSCNSAACAGDEIAKDHDLIDTRWVVTSGNATIANPTKDSADVMIAANATPGEDVVVRAYSQLSDTKNGGYGIASQGWIAPIYGEWRIRVEQGVEWDAPLRGDFKLGTWDDPGILDYMKDDLSSEYGSFIYCVRVREMNATDASDDTVVIYHTTGANVRFFPDILGLTWDRSYKIFFQVLSPVPASIWDDRASGKVTTIVPDNAADVADYYVNNVDSMGRYPKPECTEPRYKAGAMYGGVLNPPTATFECKGVVYPNSDKDYCEYYHYQPGAANESVLPRPTLGTSTNIERNAILGRMTFSVYKGDGDDPAGWEDVYVYREQGGNLGYTGPQHVGPLWVYPEASEFLKKENNNELEKSVGTYHVIPGFHYANNWNMAVSLLDYIYPLDGSGQLDKNRMGMHGEGGDYEDHYYPQENATIKVKVDMGLNLEISAGEDKWAFFPLPTEKTFPFALKSDTVQTVDWDKLSIYGSALNWKEELKNIKIDCEYYPATSKEREYYKIRLYTEQRNGLQYSRHVYGEYKWEAGMEAWAKQRGDYDESGTDKSNMELVRDVKTYLAYFPAPTEKGYPFKTGETGEKSYSLSLYQKNGSDARNVKMTVEQTSNGVIKLTSVELQGEHKQAIYDYGTYSYDSTKAEWTTSGSSSVKVQPVWRPGKVEFTYNGNPCVIEIPLPGDADFPTFSGTYETTSLVYYLQSDTYGEKAQNPYGGLKLIYTQSAGGGYTVRLDNGYYSSGTPYGTWTWEPGQTEWKKQ